LDFDDACTGPAVQDLWLALPGRDAATRRQQEIFLEGYGRFRLFDRSTLELVEVLRGLRLVRYCGWLARRREDPAFLRAWPDFGTEEYWRTETCDLEEQLAQIRRREPLGASRHPVSSTARAPGLGQREDPAELTNRDYFWDWEGD
ncbi:MAG: phosphotransferase, partial [Holophagales bacterium]|nr:phosphotransferase [Holophagales bacterium]